MLKEFQEQYVSANEQFVFTNKKGIVLESDQTLFTIEKGSSIFDFHLFFESLEVLFEGSQEDETSFHCVHIDIEGHLYIVDILAVVKKAGLLLIINNLTNHYNSYQNITQTRNESVIKTELTVLKNLELQERERFKNSFIQNFSHELRNPLMSVMAITELLADTELSDEQQQMLNFLKESNTNLRLMLEDTLSIGMIDAGKLEIEQKLFGLRRFFELMKFTYTAKAKAKGLKFVCSWGAKIPEFVVGDRLRLFQIVTNLLDNAMKYTEEGTVSFVVQLNQKRANIVSLQFRVKDTGAGISAEDQEAIFESFHRVNVSEKTKGTGLGLTITKRLLELMESKIQLESELDKGSTFYFDLLFKFPLLSSMETVSLDNNQKTFVRAVGKEQQKFKILLVDDDEYVQTTLFKMLLNTNRFKIDLAYDGAMVFQEVVSNNYDLILMDVNLPNLDGIQITKLIKDFPFKNIKNIPIIGITANAYQENIDQCLKAGMRKVLIKPFEKEALLKVLSKILK